MDEQGIFDRRHLIEIAAIVGGLLVWASRRARTPSRKDVVAAVESMARNEAAAQAERSE